MLAAQGRVGVRMGGFAEVMRERVRRAQAALDAAQESGDAYAVAVAADELDDATRLARANDVPVEAVSDAPPGGEPESGSGR